MGAAVSNPHISVSKSAQKIAVQRSKDNLMQAQSPRDVMTLLLQGNARFVAGTPAEKDLVTRRIDIAKNGQHPRATVITCADSRCSPELVFDTSLGDIFVVRTAGAVIGLYEMGSVEYAVEHLHTPLVMVVGHSKCGAVTAGCYALEKVEDSNESSANSNDERDEPTSNGKVNALPLLVGNIKANVKEQFADVFSMFDRSNTGKIHMKDLKAAIISLGRGQNDPKTKEAVANLERRGNDLISLDDFVAEMQRGASAGIEQSICSNAKQQAKALLKSGTISSLMKADKIKIAWLNHDILSGKVELLGWLQSNDD